MDSPLLHASPAAGLDEAARLVLEHLHDRLGFDLWMITRVEGEDWIVLQARDDGYHVEAGAVFRWPDTLCARMVRGQGPSIAPAVAAVPIYANAPIASELEIGAYVGVPITWPNGTLFGTLCAIDPRPAPAIVERELPLVRMLSRLLGTIVAAEMRELDAERRAERTEREAQLDELTAIPDRRAWTQALLNEERRCRVIGATASVLSIDLDGFKHVNDAEGQAAGDRLLQRTARVVKEAIRSEDVLARVGGDKFAVLLPECRGSAADRIAQRVTEALAHASVNASLGAATRRSGVPLQQAWAQAEAAMYEQKRARGIQGAQHVA